MDYRRIAQAGAIGISGLAVLVLIWVGLAGLSLSGGDHCRDTQDSLLFTTLANLTDSTPATVSNGGKDLCLVTNDAEPANPLPADWSGSASAFPGIQVADKLDGPDGQPFAYDADTRELMGMPSGAGWLLPDRYEWRQGYAFAGSLAGRFLPVLVPVLALMALLAVLGLTWREFHN